MVQLTKTCNNGSTTGSTTRFNHAVQVQPMVQPRPVQPMVQPMVQLQPRPRAWFNRGSTGGSIGVNRWFNQLNRARGSTDGSTAWLNHWFKLNRFLAVEKRKILWLTLNRTGHG